MKITQLLVVVAIIIGVIVYWKNTENFRYRRRHRYPHYYYTYPYYSYPSLYTYFPFYYPYTYTPCIQTVSGEIVCN